MLRKKLKLALVLSFLSVPVFAKPVPGKKIAKNDKAKAEKVKADKTAKTAKPLAAAAENAPVTPAVTEVENSVKANLHVFIDGEKNLYWPMDLPFWVRLASSPEDGASSFLLKKFETSPSKKDDQQKLQDGLKVEIPGSQFLRWVHYVSKEETRYRFFSDGAPPVVGYQYSKAPVYAGHDRIYFGAGLTVTPVAKDEHAGVESRYIAVAEKPFEVFNGAPIPLAEERLYKLQAYATDQVGYVSKIVSTSFQVDLTPPRTVSSNKGLFKENLLTRNAKISLKSVDDLSGVRQVAYKFDSEANFRAYDAEQEISLEGLKDGQHVLMFYATDHVANREMPQKYLFSVDSSAPSMAHTFVGDYHAVKGKTYVSSKTRLKLDANDSQVKVKDVTYRVGTNPEQSYSSPFMPAVKSGEFSIHYSSVDELGNVSRPTELQLVMDNDAPASSYEVRGPSYAKDKGVIYLSGKSAIALKAADALAGVRDISYQLNDQPPNLYQSPINLTKDGRYLLRYWATDAVGNQESISTILLIVDDGTPEIVSVLSQDPVRTTEKGPAYLVNTALTLNAIDGSSGVDQIRYQLNNGKGPEVYSNPIVFTKVGPVEVTVIASDKVGNKSSKKLNFEILGGSWNQLAH